MNQALAQVDSREAERAFEFEKIADVVIYHEFEDRIQLWTHDNQRGGSDAIDDTLGRVLASISSKRDWVVVIIGKPTRAASSGPQLRAKVDAIEAVVTAQGFVKVVFELASAEGRPIYRE